MSVAGSTVGACGRGVPGGGDAQAISTNVAASPASGCARSNDRQHHHAGHHGNDGRHPIAAR